MTSPTRYEQVTDISGARGAVLSDDGTYRFLLWRTWAPSRPTMLWVMLNPSTADALRDDATIRLCRNRAEREGYGRIEVVNLFAYRATDPSELERCPVDVVGPGNNRWIREAAERAGVVVVAWGGHAQATTLRVREAMSVIRRPVLCIGTTASGAPRHPRGVPNEQPLVPWQGPMPPVVWRAT